MLVRFTSKAAASVSMFEKDATRMLSLMAHSGTIPSAIRAQDVAERLKVMEKALAGDLTGYEDTERTDEDEPPPIPVNRRAYPLMELMRAAVNAREGIMWDYEHSTF